MPVEIAFLEAETARYKFKKYSGYIVLIILHYNSGKSCTTKVNYSTRQQGVNRS